MDQFRDEELVVQAQHGDENAFSELYRRYQKRLEYVANRLCNNQEDAKDAVQQTFLQAHRSIHSLRDPNRFYHWCCRIVHGKCTDMFRKNKDINVDMMHSPLVTSVVEERPDHLPWENHRFKSDQHQLLSFISQLPYVQRQVVLLVYFDQMSMQECANCLNVPEGTVKSRLYSAKRSLREKIETYNSQSNVPLNFRSSEIPTWISAVCVASMPKQFFLTHHMGKMMAIGSAGLVVLGIAVFAAISHDPIQGNSVSAPFPSEITAKEAYFKLKMWAVDERQMLHRESADVERMVVYYDILKSNGGVYYETLVKSGWIDAFDAIRK